MRRLASLAVSAAAAAVLSPALAAAPPTPAPTGRYGAVIEYDPARNPTQTVYRPRDLNAARGLPILAWGNGACADVGGGGAQPMLLEIASHGYVVIAPGIAKVDTSVQPLNDTRPPGPPPGAARPPGAPGAGGPPPGPPPGAGPAPGEDATQASQLIAAIDWATAENARRDSIYFGKLDPKKVAVAGHSCGGLQALAVQQDPRIVTTMIFDSGVYIRPGGRSGVKIDKSQLKAIHGPIIYFLGGPTDIAYENGMDDFQKIDHVPAMVAELNVGHGGTMGQANGGSFGKAAIAWLDWRLKGDRTASAMFTGANCGLCANPVWKVARKGM